MSDNQSDKKIVSQSFQLTEDYIHVRIQELFSATGNPNSIHLTALSWMLSKRLHIPLSQIASIIKYSGKYVISSENRVSLK